MLSDVAHATKSILPVDARAVGERYSGAAEPTWAGDHTGKNRTQNASLVTTEYSTTGLHLAGIAKYYTTRTVH
jgi:hypothetical protein